EPAPGTATVEDLIRYSAEDDRLYELVDGTLVEKAMGWQESLLGGLLLHWLHDYLEKHNLGEVVGADAFMRLFSDTVRAPDVAFVSWERLPGGRLPTQPVPDIVPDFVIEVLSTGNTYGEMSRKRREYFHAGVRLVWMVHPRQRTITVYTSAQEFTVVKDDERITGGDVLPGWSFHTADFFSRLDREAPPKS
ncbi:MAG: Uma2 family endonuclease, partial [Planctomycetaceae bacterium]